MTPVKPGSYLFRREGIAELRGRLGLTQAKMAEELGVPKNTVSRWETGETTPDADSLAAIYSLAKERGMEVNFFSPVKQKAPVRDAALVYWDLPQVYFWYTGDLKQQDEIIRKEVRRRVPHATRYLYKAFFGSSNSTASAELEKLDWRIWEPDSMFGSQDWSDDIYDQALSDAGQSLNASVVFLVTSSNDHVDLIKELKGRDVLVYLIPMSSGGTFSSTVSPDLIAAVGKRRVITFD